LVDQYRIVGDMADYSKEALSALKLRHVFISEIHYFDVVDSTNTLACKLALEGAAEGECVLADAQTKGRGRLDRTWHSPSGRNIYMSLILRPPVEPAAAPQITLMAGVAVAELFSGYCGGAVAIKWPNDVLLAGKKACGILTEMKAVAGRVDFVILGMGLNINMNPQDFDPVLRDSATSLSIQTGRGHDRIEMISGLFASIAKWYKIYLDKGFSGLRKTWLAYAGMVGRRIRVVYKDEVQVGSVAGIDDDGTILLQDDRGAIHRVIAGDIHTMGG
jgi:BirA family biotin operon repressor/biotin-[acetyl-CoA-carboxylase] ligase